MKNLTFTPEEAADIWIALVNAQADLKLSVKNRLEGSIYDPLYEFLRR